MKNCEIIQFLSNHITEELCSLAFVFGSIARNNPTPSDCDLFIVTPALPGSRLWTELKEMLEKIHMNDLGLSWHPGKDDARWSMGILEK